MNWKAILLSILIRLLEKMTPEFRRELCLFLRQWREKAKATENPIDDVVFESLLILFACEDE